MELSQRIIRSVLSISFLIAGVYHTLAQTTSSPFDIVPRISGFVANDSTIATVISSNPFDIISTGPARRPANSPGFTVEKQKVAVSAQEKEAVYRRFLFIAVVAMLVILTLLVTVFRMLLNRIWQAFLNDNLLSQLIREQGAGLDWAYRILYAMFFLNAGLFTFLSLRYYNVNMADSNLTSLLLVTGCIAGYFILKHLVLRILRFVYPVGKEVTVYSFTIQIFNIVSGFLLIPSIVFIAYAPDVTVEPVIYGTVAAVVLVFMFLILRGLFIANRFLAWNKFHFFLYLCAVEIAPVLILIKQFLPAHDA